MAIILTFYALFVLFGLAVAWFVYRRLRRFGRVPAGLAGLVCLALVALCYPIPIHGGFTTVLEMLLEEFGRQRSHWQQQARDERKMAFLHGYEQRFAGELPFRVRAEASGDWQPVATAGGQPAWLDHEHHLVWSDAFPWQANADFSLAAPRAFCRQLPPPGCWSLPSTAELALFWRTGGAEATGSMPPPSVSTRQCCWRCRASTSARAACAASPAPPGPRRAAISTRIFPWSCGTATSSPKHPESCYAEGMRSCSR